MPKGKHRGGGGPGSKGRMGGGQGGRGSDIDQITAAIVGDATCLGLQVSNVGTGWPPSMQFLLACHDGDIDRLKAVVNSMDEDDKESLDSVRFAGYGPLHSAASSGNMEICRYLVEQLGFNVDSDANNHGSGITPLYSAVSDGKLIAVRYFLDKGADPNKKDSKGLAPLHVAAAEGHHEIAQLLLSKGASVDVPSSKGTPLVVAAAHGKFSVMKILLEHNADPNKVSWDFGTPLTTSLYATPERMNESTCIKCMELLVKAGADVNCKIPDTPLGIATSKGLTKCLKYILEVRANANIPINHDKESDKDRKASRKSHNKDKESKAQLKLQKKDKESKDRLKLQGAEAVHGNNYAAASKFYTEAIKLDSADAKLYSNRSLCRLKCGEAHDALLDANACIRLDPQWTKGYYRKGYALMSLLDFKEAREAFAAGLKLDPENKEMQEALREATEALRKDRTEPSLYAVD